MLFDKDHSVADSLFRPLNLRSSMLVALVTLLGFAVLVLPVKAHHPLEGMSPENYNAWQGILSGLVHPVLGIDHLVFLVSIGLARLVDVRTWVLLLISCALIGSITGLILPPLLLQEAWMGLSLIALAVVSLKRFPPIWVLPLAMFHGYVLAGAMVGAKPTPLAGYLCGLLVSELALIIIGFLLVQRFQSQSSLMTGIVVGFGLSITGAAILP